MATIRAYTTIEQSRKLAEFLPLESADIYYAGHRSVINPKEWEYGDTPKIRGKYTSFDDKRIFYPAWSLAALLGVLPQSITKYIEGESCQKTFHLNLFRSYYHCVGYSFTPSVNDDNTLYCIGRDNWVDACVAMIEK